MREPLFTETLQVALVVRDLESAMETYVSDYGVGVRDYDATLEEFAERGHEVVLGGEYNGISFSYLSTDRDLGVITEIFSGAPGADQKPDAVYP
jgi:hypothetical protein